MHRIFLTLLIGTETIFASRVDLPYTSGKQVLEFTLPGGADSVRVGNRFTLQRASWKGEVPAVCGYQDPIGIRVHGATMKSRGNLDTTWRAYPAYPSAQDSLTTLDSIGGEITFPNGAQTGGASGFWFAETGGRNDCSGNIWGFREGARRVFFVEGNGVYAKLKLVSYRDSVVNPTPLLHYSYLARVTFRMVVNTSPNDLVDPNPPASLRSRPVVNLSGAKGAIPGRYDLRGVLLKGEPQNFSPALPRR